MFLLSDHETTQSANLRWYRHTTTEPPVLQYLERGEGMKDGKLYYIERWTDVPLVIGEVNHG